MLKSFCEYICSYSVRMKDPVKRCETSFSSLRVFLSACFIVCIFTGSFKANGVLIHAAVAEYGTSFTYAGGAYVAQFALAFMFGKKNFDLQIL